MNIHTQTWKDENGVWHSQSVSDYKPSYFWRYILWALIILSLITSFSMMSSVSSTPRVHCERGYDGC